MFKTKSLAAILLVVAVLFAQVGTVFAAAPLQTSTIDGTIKDIQTETTNGVTTVLVTVLDPATNTTQTVRLSVETAAGLGLLQLDPVTKQPILDPTTNEPLVDQTKLETTVNIDSTTVIPDQEPEVSLISKLLADFFFHDDPTMAVVIDSFHTGDNDAQQVFGFGVIAQALWMSKDSEGNANAELAGDILLAKQSKDYTQFFSDHPEYADQFGDNMPTNWGQFKKVLAEHKNNLGTIVSGKANDDDTTGLNTQEHRNNKDKNKNKGKGPGNENGNKP